VVHRAEHERHHLGAVADAFLPPAAAAPGARAAPPLFAAAPGATDTAAVLEILRPSSKGGTTRDLGAAIGVRLGRLERSGAMAPVGATSPLLIWCPRAEEGLSLTAALALGRLGALIRPARITMLWFAASGPRTGREPTAAQVAAAGALARAAAGKAVVGVHCVGWTDDPLRQLGDLVGRFG
jgi:hypothetical protein